MSAAFKYIVVGVLIGAVIVLATVCIYQGVVITVQKETIIEMYRYIHAGCPSSMIH